MACSTDGHTSNRMKPVIDEIIRTQHCKNPLSLLLDRIHVVVRDQHNSEEDAYRIWLSDGTKVIQGVLQPDLHPFLNAGEARAGSLVVVTKYRLIRATRCRGKGWVWVLVLIDMDVIGHDGRTSTEMHLETRESTQKSNEVAGQKDNEHASARDSARKSGNAGSGKRRRTDSDSEESPWNRAKFRRTSSSPSPTKPEIRPALKETDTNNVYKTPTKPSKFHSAGFFSSPTHKSPLSKQLRNDNS